MLPGEGMLQPPSPQPPTHTPLPLQTTGNLRQVNHMFDRLYNNLNSLRLPTPSQQPPDDNLLDDSSSFKEKVQIRDFSEYLRPKIGSHKGVSPDFRSGNRRTQRQNSSPAFSPKVNMNSQNREASFLGRELQHLQAALSQKDFELNKLRQTVKELEDWKKKQQHRKPQLTPVVSNQNKQLQDEIEFLKQNNQNLYRTSIKLTSQIDRLKADMQQKEDKEKQFSERITELERNLHILKKANKQLLKEQANLIKTSEEEVNLFKTVKEQFERENALLKKRVHFLEIERNTSVNALRNISLQEKQYFNSMTHRPAENHQNSLEMAKLRSQIELIKANLNNLSSVKKEQIINKVKGRKSSSHSRLD